jgi:hypothetical protein
MMLLQNSSDYYQITRYVLKVTFSSHLFIRENIRVVLNLQLQYCLQMSAVTSGEQL